MKLHPSFFEQITALTDLILGVLSLYAILQLWRFSGSKPVIWIASFGFLLIASFFGAAAHGFEMSARTNDLLWKPINFSLGLALSLFVVGALYDWKGEEILRTALMTMLGLGILFFIITLLIPGQFWIFLGYEGIAMIFALGIYSMLTLRGIHGAAWMTAGIIITILAALVQASGKVGISIIWYFDNNGMFHLIQMAGLILLLRGLIISI